MGHSRIDAQIKELLRTVGAETMAFDPTGASMAPVPAPFAGLAATRTDVESPLDPIAPISQGRGGGLYELARRNRSASPITMPAVRSPLPGKRHAGASGGFEARGGWIA